MNSKYSGMNEHDILIIVAEAAERQEKHLITMNGSLANHEKRIIPDTDWTGLVAIIASLM